jgi:hypothetical protein
MLPGAAIRVASSDAVRIPRLRVEGRPAAGGRFDSDSDGRARPAGWGPGALRSLATRERRTGVSPRARVFRQRRLAAPPAPAPASALAPEPAPPAPAPAGCRRWPARSARRRPARPGSRRRDPHPHLQPDPTPPRPSPPPCPPPAHPPTRPALRASRLGRVGGVGCAWWVRCAGAHGGSQRRAGKQAPLRPSERPPPRGPAQRPWAGGRAPREAALATTRARTPVSPGPGGPMPVRRFRSALSESADASRVRDAAAARQWRRWRRRRGGGGRGGFSARWGPSLNSDVRDCGPSRPRCGVACSAPTRPARPPGRAGTCDSVTESPDVERLRFTCRAGRLVDGW